MVDVGVVGVLMVGGFAVCLVLCGCVMECGRLPDCAGAGPGCCGGLGGEAGEAGEAVANSFSFFTSFAFHPSDFFLYQSVLLVSLALLLADWLKDPRRWTGWMPRASALSFFL